MTVYEIIIKLPDGQTLTADVTSDMPPTDVVEWVSDLTTFDVLSFRVTP